MPVRPIKSFQTNLEQSFNLFLLVSLMIIIFIFTIVIIITLYYAKRISTSIHKPIEVHKIN